MIALMAEWWSRLFGTPLLLACVAVAAAGWAYAVAVLWRRIPGVAWRMAWGMGALGYLLAMVAFIAPPPERRTAVVPLLVTEGATSEALSGRPDTVDAFITGAAWQEPAVADWVRRRVRAAAAGRTVRVSSIDDLALYGAPPRRLRVVGDGLDAAAWSGARWQGAVDFERPQDPAGIADARWPRSVETGLPFAVAARTTAAVPDGAEFVLRDAENAPLSAVPAAVGSVEAPVLPAGRHVLQLTLELESNEIERLAVPVVVREPAPARVLVLQSAPSFEWRAIGRWLSRAGAIVATRTRISESRFRERYEGMPERPLTPLDDGLLEAFDLVIADGAALSTLADAERAWLLDANHGAGVLLLLHDGADVEALPPVLRSRLTGDVASESIYQLPGAADRLDTGLSRAALAFGDATGDALVSDIAGVPVVVRAAPGSPVALSLVRDSYRLAAVGAADAHARLWSSIVRKLARAAPARDARIEPPGSRAGERVRICVPVAAAPGSITLRDGADNAFDIDLVVTPWRPAERCGWAWPTAPGWLTAWRSGGAGAPAPLGTHWVAPAGEVATRRRLARIDATVARAGRGSRAEGDALSDAATMPRSRFLGALLLFGLLVALSERLSAARHHGRRGRS